MAENTASEERQSARAAADDKAREAVNTPRGGSATATPGSRSTPARRELQHVESAPEGVHLKDALGNDPQFGPGNQAPADRTIVEVIDDEPAAKSPDDVDVGPNGIALPAGGEIAGGNIAKVLDAPPDASRLSGPLTKEQAALQTPIFQKLAGIVARPPEMWGLIGPGETIRGHMMLLDLNTGEKVRGMDGHRVNEGELYANLRNLPEALSAGDTIDRVLGA